MLTLPNLITISRLLCVPALIGAAIADRPSLFIGLLAYALLSDAVDGRLARARGQATPFGARLDSTADCALYLTAPVAALRVFPDVRAHLAGAVFAVYAGYLVPIVYGAIKYRRLTSYHTIGARLAGVLLSVAAFLVLLTGVQWPFYVATTVLLVSAIEEMAITRILPAWESNIPSVWHALQRRTS
ncbi:MAG TPA: CDP-alcohol phosphatidyltransferase family protein [Gemmatimonadaceae bacterium]|nr:CDP-alcohol phosphatidyltransferase family protein [Gemmatimonadaceae bacterium]